MRSDPTPARMHLKDSLDPSWKVQGTLFHFFISVSLLASITLQILAGWPSFAWRADPLALHVGTAGLPLLWNRFRLNPANQRSCGESSHVDRRERKQIPERRALGPHAKDQA